MTPEELDEARAKEAYRQWQEEGCQGDDTIDVAARAARLARENWTPPEPVDPDFLAFREWAEKMWPLCAGATRRGDMDPTDAAQAFLAGARMAREQERERAKVLVDQAKATIDLQARLLGRLPLGMRTQFGIVGAKIMDATSSFYNTLSKYEEGGR